MFSVFEVFPFDGSLCDLDSALFLDVVFSMAGEVCFVGVVVGDGL